MDLHVYETLLPGKVFPTHKLIYCVVWHLYMFFPVLSFGGIKGSYIVYVFLYGRLYLALSGLEFAIMKQARMRGNRALQAAMGSQSIVQLGLLMALPMFMEIGLERGFRSALGDFIIMQLQLCSVFLTLSLSHYFILFWPHNSPWWYIEQLAEVLLFAM